MSEFQISDSERGFDYWLNQDFISPETRVILEKANILVVPEIGFRDSDSPLFHREIGDLTEYLIDNQPEDIVTELCINDEDYKELSLCSDEIRLGEIIISSVVLPLAVNLLTEFIKYLVKKKRMNKNDANVEVKITVSDKKRTKSFKYSGKANDFEKVSSTIEELWKGK